MDTGADLDIGKSSTISLKVFFFFFPKERELRLRLYSFDVSVSEPSYQSDFSLNLGPHSQAISCLKQV